MQANAISTPTSPSGSAAWPGWLACLAARLRTNGRASMGIMLLGVFVTRVPHLPAWSGDIGERGFASFAVAVLLPNMLENIVAAGILLVVFSASTDKASDMLRRPGRFVLVLLGGSATAMVVLMALGAAFGKVPPVFNADRAIVREFFTSWMRFVASGGLFGWLGFLAIERAEVQANLFAVLARRSMLARQFAQARLVATRARIDPELVTHVLREVKARYASAPVPAALLMDHLIAYLRLAMNRTRERQPSFASDVLLCRSFVALRETETGLPITWRSQEPGASAPLPLFLAVRLLLSHAIGAGPTAIGFSVMASADCTTVELDIRGVTLSAADTARLDADLDKLAGDAMVSLTHTISPGSKRHVVRLARV